MTVRYAGQVMNNTVACDLELRQWPKITETVKFIREVNDFFDCINGAHSEHGNRTRNENLKPYTSQDDARFAKLQGFYRYLSDWKEEIDKKPKFTREEKQKMFISEATFEGVEITVGGIIGAIIFLLSKGMKYVNARTFDQDCLEQYFGKVRAGLGGGTNPNVKRALELQNKLSIAGETGSRKGFSGNTQTVNKSFAITDEPLEKRKGVQRPKNL